MFSGGETVTLHIRKNTQKSKFLLSQAFKWKRIMFFVIPEMPSKTFVRLYKKLYDHFKNKVKLCLHHELQFDLFVRKLCMNKTELELVWSKINIIVPEFGCQGDQKASPIYWVTQKLPQICTAILRICIGQVAWFAVYICSNFWVTQFIYITITFVWGKQYLLLSWLFIDK